MTGESVCVLALFGGNRGNGSKCGLSYWNVNNPATNVNTTNFVPNRHGVGSDHIVEIALDGIENEELRDPKLRF